ncbi:MAG: hypothetical protein H6735_06390 [Alphaproteobacteria bacterium]|nr:hypothetical protein [Alphaproteobacteria bacterium]
MSEILATTARVLRSPRGLVEEADDPRVLGRIVPHLLLVTTVGAAVFGAVVGSYRGGEQTLYAALKMPLLYGIPLLVGLPAARALFEAFGAEVRWSRLAVAGLAGTARAAVLAAALGPALWLVYSLAPGYHLAVLLMVLLLGVAGAPGLLTVAEAVPAGRARWLGGLAALAVLGLVTAQTGWLLRPFVARPNAEVTLFRPVEGDVFGSLLRVPLASVDVYLEYEPQRKRVLGGR